MNPDTQAAIVLLILSLAIVLFVLWVGKHEDGE